MVPPKLRVRNLSLFYGTAQVLKGISMDIAPHRVTALIGASGSGKSSFLRCLNRLNDLIPAARVRGQVLLDGKDIYAAPMDAAALRRRVGMVFQRPTPFPTSVFENVAYGPRRHGLRDARRLHAAVEECLRRTGLWGEVRGRLHLPALHLSGGQQQRLCLARALAVQPEVLLLDEPTAALDPGATRTLEELILALKDRYTVVVVTHNLHQAVRIAGDVGYFHAGELVEQGPAAQVLRTPRDRRTLDYLNGYG